MTNAFGLTLVVLRCADLERSRRFYEALGLILNPERHGAGPRRYSAQVGRAVLELYPDASGSTRGLRLGLELIDLDAAVSALAKIGAVPRPGSPVTIDDPDGHRLELHSASAAQQAVAAADRHTLPLVGRLVPRPRRLRPRLLAAVLRSTVILAFAAERQVVSQTDGGMVDEGESEKEFFEDFGASRLDDGAVQALLVRARSSGDTELRRLVKEVQMWRQFAPQLLDRVAPLGSPVDESDGLLKIARFIIRGEGKIAG